MPALVRSHPFIGQRDGCCDVCNLGERHLIHSPRLNVPLARVLLERAQDGYVNPTGGKTTGRERKDG